LPAESTATPVSQLNFAAAPMPSAYPAALLPARVLTSLPRYPPDAVVAEIRHIDIASRINGHAGEPVELCRGADAIRISPRYCLLGCSPPKPGKL